MRKFFLIATVFSSTHSFSQTDDELYSVSFYRQGTYDIASGPHVGFPSVVKLPSDSLLIVYRRGSSHVEPSGKIVRKFGSPDGSIWSAEETVINTLFVDDRDPSLTSLSDERIMLSYYTYKAGSTGLYPPTPAICSMHAAFSEDQGATFPHVVSIDMNESLSLPAGAVFTGTGYEDAQGNPVYIYASSAPAVELPHKLVLPGYGGSPLISDSVAGSNAILSDPWRLCFFESDDMGETWEIRLFAEDFLPETWLAEPALIKQEDGNYMMQIRCADDDENPMSPGPLRQAKLDEDLQVFSHDKDIPLVGHAPDLFRMSSGVLVSGFRLVNPVPNSQDVCFIFSIDDGITWSDTIRVQQGTTESGYPSFTELKDGRLMVSYYTSGGQRIKGTIYDVSVLYKSDHINPLLDVSQEFSTEVLIAPNPNNGFFSVAMQGEYTGGFDLIVFNLNGETAYSQRFSAYDSSQLFLDLTGLEAGTYFIRVNFSDKSVTEIMTILP